MRFRFGAFELDEQAGELLRAGASVRIQPKPFELLCLLIRERARVVGSDELMQTLWPDTIVSPASLNRAVSHARRAIDDTGRGAVIKSIPRRGYRFVGDVTEVDLAAATSSSVQIDSDAHSKMDSGAASPTSVLGDRTRTSDSRGIDELGFVGRRDALARLDAARESVVGGATRTALVSGPPGIGKTRLTEVFMEDAKRRGLFVVFSRCRDREGMPPFWIWAQVLRALVQEQSFREAITARAASGEIAALMPGFRDFAPEVMSDLGDPETGDLDLSSEQQRFRFFDAALRALRVCAQLRPIVLVLDDIQWAGSGSLRLLEHIALEFDGAPLLLLATVRDETRERGHPVDQTLSLLRQQARSESIELSGLSRGEVGELLRAAIGDGRPAPIDLISELYARTEGIPFFVGEATRLLEERGDLAHPERIPRNGVTLPARAVDLIRRSIDHVSVECADLLGRGRGPGPRIYDDCCDCRR